MRPGTSMSAYAIYFRFHVSLMLATMCAVAFFWANPALARETPVSLRDSFPLGAGAGSLCQVQSKRNPHVERSIYDRSWSIVCRDSALPVGQVFALRDQGEPLDRLAQHRAGQVNCATEQSVAPMPGADTEQVCRYGDGISYSVATRREGGTLYVAEGFKAYEDALSLALRSIVNDEIVDGEISIATISVSEGGAFSRLQALTLDPEQALAEGYRRNSSGSYAEAAAFFETLSERVQEDRAAGIELAEVLVNRALQKSNLGEFSEADRLFAQARDVGTDSPVVERLRRNFEGIHLINQRKFADAIARLEAPVKVALDNEMSLRNERRITRPISDRINASDEASNLLGFVDDKSLTPTERAIIIDAQAKALVASARQRLGDNMQARQALREALNTLVSVRDGRVVSIIRLRARIIAELALIEEGAGNIEQAEALLKSAVSLIEVQYPASAALATAQAKLGAFLARHDRPADAIAIYRQVVEGALERGDNVVGLANFIAPYFDLLVDQMPDKPALAADMFDATQILVRPGVAETQAILSRELSSGSDEGARMFREAQSLSRSLERAHMREIALSKLEQTPAVMSERSTLQAEIVALERMQQSALVALADYPQFRAISSQILSLEELQSMLKSGEAYGKLSAVSGGLYMFFATADSATGYRLDIDEEGLSQTVDTIRESISYFDGFQYVTTPFDVEGARELYAQLLGPVDAGLTGVDHLIFEPDGAMLRLPINLLVADDDSVDRYNARIARIDGDPFNVADVNWLGRDHEVSTAVSARAFFDARHAKASSANKQYLGLGENRAISAAGVSTGVRGMRGNGSEECEWPLTEWNNPISSAELRQAQTIFGTQSEVVTGEAFADDRILQRGDLDEFRIVHFATHGFVTAPAPQCPARPALLTSFGGPMSDGLLSFREIFDLKLDADVVILSACDTAGQADVRATREAGLSSGGGTALDGLVRSFIGAGGRSVIASHWPAPDDFDATKRLITGLFEAEPGVGIGDALRNAQQELMNDPVTSHPYYWSGFAIIGDAARPMLVRSVEVASASEANEAEVAKAN